MNTIRPLCDHIGSRCLVWQYTFAGTPNSSSKGLRVYSKERIETRNEVPSPASTHKYWTRRGLAEWRIDCLREDTPTLIGIDRGFSFPEAYFDKYRLKRD